MQVLVQALLIAALVAFFAWMLYLRVSLDKRRLRARDSAASPSSTDEEVGINS